jgi:hypothetical protein
MRTSVASYACNSRVVFAAMLGGTTSRGRQHECGVRSTLDHPETVPLRVHRLDHITVKYRQYWEKLGNKMNESTSVTSTLQIHDLSDGSATVHDEYMTVLPSLFHWTFIG